MRIIREFTEKELRVVLDDFYSYFQSGFEFEEFLKPFLETIGLTEVFVTKKTGDGGVDLTAVKEGISEINNVDRVKYRIQAKRNAPNSRISPEKIDALRGNLGFNEKWNTKWTIDGNQTIYLTIMWGNNELYRIEVFINRFLGNIYR